MISFESMKKGSLVCVIFARREKILSTLQHSWPVDFSNYHVFESDYHLPRNPISNRRLFIQVAPFYTKIIRYRSCLTNRNGLTNKNYEGFLNYRPMGKKSHGEYRNARLIYEYIIYGYANREHIPARTHLDRVASVRVSILAGRKFARLEIG